MRLDRELEESLDDGAADGVVAAAGTERRDRALVVATGIAEVVHGGLRMRQCGFADVGHGG